jgi:thymidylate synthase
MTLIHPEYQYLSLLDQILTKGSRNVDRGTGAVSYSLFGGQARYDLTYGFPLLTTKKVYWTGVLYELFWFLRGENNIRYLVDHKVNIWNEYPYKRYKKACEEYLVPPLSMEEFVEKIRTDDAFAAHWGVLKNIYGQLWRSWPTKNGGSTDQLQWVLDELKADPDARNLIVNSWNPEYLYSMAPNPREALRFPICHNMFQVSQKDGKINLHLYQRSADMFLGVPFNIASYALLAHIIAHVLGYQVGDLIHTLGDLHIYENHINQVKEQLTRVPREFPKLYINPQALSLDTILPEHVMLEDYNPHSTLKGELTVAGGYYEDNYEKAYS